jgi:hypothetical protein
MSTNNVIDDVMIELSDVIDLKDLETYNLVEQILMNLYKKIKNQSDYSLQEYLNKVNYSSHTPV